MTGSSSSEAAPSGPEALEQLREKIDEVDNKILDLLNERTTLAIAAYSLKAEMMWRFDTRREWKIMERLTERNTGPLEYGDVTSIYASIFESTRRVQRTSSEPEQSQTPKEEN